MTKEKALLELQTMYRHEAMRNVRDLQETIGQEARMRALVVAMEELEDAIKAEKECAEIIKEMNGRRDGIDVHTTPLSEAVNSAEERLSGCLHTNPVYNIFKSLNNDSEPMKIKVKYFADIDPIVKLPQGSWIDLRCAEETQILEGKYAQIPLGVAMELPDGYEAVVAPRSSTFRKYGIILANSIGVIDPDYRGDNDQWHFLAYAVRNTVIPKNERICQFRIQKRQPEVEFLTVDHLGNPDRGGIGSTGRI